VLLMTNQAGIVECRAGRRDRLWARLHAGELDRRLCRGVAPETGVHLALRAEVLVRPQVRSDLARRLEGVLSLADRPARAATPFASICRGRVRAARLELQLLRTRLLATGPVSPQGVALVKALLTDGTGPLYQQTCRDDLASMVREAVATMDRL
jgi:hypothetical protein